MLRFLKGSDESQKPSMSMVSAASGFAGFCAVAGNNPVDVVKTRMQSMEAHRYKGSLDCLLVIVKEEGYGALFRGIIPRMIRKVPGQMILFNVYELVSSNLQDMMDEP